MRVILWLFAALFFVFASCKEDENLLSVSDAIVFREELSGCWIHSREESSMDPDEMVYRPCDFKEYPASRYRHKMELKENGECSWLQLAANDAHFMADGHWVYDPDKRELEIFNTSGVSVEKFLIVETGENLLKLMDIR